MRSETNLSRGNRLLEHKIILSADSTCDLGDELRQRYHVQYYPFHVILDGKAYSDGVDLVPDQIYQVYEEKHILPKTAAINAAEYVEYFKKWTDQGYEVIHVTLGSGLSATYQNCCLAAKELPGFIPSTAGTCPPAPAWWCWRRQTALPKGCPAAHIAKEVRS